MRLVFSHDIFTSQQVGGISRYFCELAGALASTGHSVTVEAGGHGNHHLRDLSARDPSGAAVTVRGRFTGASGQMARFWNEVRFAARPTRSDLLHRTYYPLVDLDRRRGPVVTTVHDMVWERYAGESPSFPINSRLKRRAVELADAIIVPSHESRRDLCDLWNVPADRVHVVHHGFSPFAPPDDRPGEPPVGGSDGRPGGKAANAGAPYILFVGRRGGYKNFSGLLAGFAQAGAARDWHLLCFGGGPFGEDETAAIVQAGLAGRVHQRGGDDRALAAAFREAALFVYPSLCEGFGLPVLEAMSAGCPVAVAEGTGALTEVAGDAAFRFDALNPESLAHLLDTVLPDADWRDRMRVAGTRRCLDFGWDRCAEGTSAVYRRLV
ncbi:MAG: hypothetical protein RLY86_3059 [Pseudomonadota bacterium]|jgi:glycosyltransferase involved in cell wall biosynthesis